MDTKSDAYTPITEVRKSDEILNDLLASRRFINIKGLKPCTLVFKVRPLSATSTLIVCAAPPASKAKTLLAGAILQFDLGDEKYVSEAKIHFSGKQVHLKLATPLYRVQRRQDFRLRLPRSYQGKFIFSVDGRKVSARLLDLSAGGCRLEIKYADLTRGQKTLGQLVMLGRDPISIEAEVRHLRRSSENDKLATVGLLFVNPKESSKNKMAALVMDLYREFFKIKNY